MLKEDDSLLRCVPEISCPLQRQLDQSLRLRYITLFAGAQRHLPQHHSSPQREVGEQSGRGLCFVFRMGDERV